MMLIIFSIFFIMFCYLLFIYLSQKRMIKNIVLLLKNFSTYQDINFPINENFDSQIAMLLKALQKNQLSIIESSVKDKDMLQSLISDLAHQLKTPLTNLKMYQRILDDPSLTLEENELFKNKLKVQVSKIEWIVHSLVNCMKLEENTISFTTKSLPIKKTLIESIDSVQFSADLKNIQITCQKSTNWDINVIHNYDWTREVFINVLENAMKYSDINSEISINISKTELYVIISISDHGIGIKEQNLSKIFQRFYRCPEVYHLNGNGIGLYLSRLILEKENGYITVESIYEKGSTFNIWLPTFFN